MRLQNLRLEASKFESWGFKTWGLRLQNLRVEASKFEDWGNPTSRLRIHKPAIRAGGSALLFKGEYPGGEVAVKIPRPDRFQGGRMMNLRCLRLEASKFDGWGFKIWGLRLEASNLEAWGFKIWGLRLQISRIEAIQLRGWVPRRQDDELKMLEAWGFKIWRLRLQNLRVEAWGFKTWGLRLQNLRVEASNFEDWGNPTSSRLRIHKPAIGAGGSALLFRGEYPGGEVAVKIPRPDRFQGGRMMNLRCLRLEASNFDGWGFKIWGLRLEASKLEAWGFKIWGLRLQISRIEAIQLRGWGSTNQPLGLVGQLWCLGANTPVEKSPSRSRGRRGSKEAGCWMDELKMLEA